MKVKVTIDRPLGCVHKNIIYQVNYGYVSGVIGGDGEEQDVYVLDNSIHSAVKEYCGEVIAVITRDDDIETKWVVSNEKLSADEIYKQVKFVEQYFCSHVHLIDDCSAEML